MNAAKLRILVLCAMAVITLAPGCDDASIRTKPERPKQQEQTADNQESVVTARDIADMVLATYGLWEESKFLRVGRARYEVSGTLQPGYSGTFVVDESFSLPGKFRREVRGQLRGRGIVLIYVMNGDQGWNVVPDGSVVDVPMTGPIKDAYPLSFLRSLSAVLDVQNDLTLTPYPSALGKSVVNLRIEQSGQWVSDLRVDKDSHRVVSTMRPMPVTVGDDVQTAIVETRYSNYRQIKGVPIPMTFYTFRDGTRTMSVRYTEMEFLPKIDDELFSKPRSNVLN